MRKSFLLLQPQVKLSVHIAWIRRAALFAKMGVMKKGVLCVHTAWIRRA